MSQGEVTNRAQAGLSRRTFPCPLAAGATSTCSRDFSWAFRQSAGSSSLPMLDLLPGPVGDKNRLHTAGFPQSLTGEQKGGRNAGLRHLPASSGAVPSCCKVGCWSSEMNPTDILKQIGLVGAASERNNLLNPPWNEKERATSLHILPSLAGIITWLKDGLLSGGKQPPVWSAQSTPMKTCTRSRSCAYNPGRLILMLS